MTSHVLDAVDPLIVQELRDAGVPKELEAGTHLFSEGDPSDHAYLIDTGFVRIERYARSGRRLVLTVASRGDMVGEYGALSAGPRSASAVALTGARLWSIPYASLEAILTTRPALTRALAASLVWRLRELSSQILDVATAPASTRIATRLLQLVGARQHIPGNRGHPPHPRGPRRVGRAQPRGRGCGSASAPLDAADLHISATRGPARHPATPCTRHGMNHRPVRATGPRRGSTSRSAGPRMIRRLFRFPASLPTATPNRRIAPMPAGHRGR